MTRRASLSLLCSSILLFGACGDDSGDGGDQFDGPSVGADAGGDFSDAPIEPLTDAGRTGDARTDFTGLDDPCCDPTGQCTNGMVCLDNLTVRSCGDDPTTDAGPEPAIDAGMAGGICRPTCTPGFPDDCPFPSACRMFSGGIGGVCLPAVGDDEACGAGIRCADGLICVTLTPGGSEHFCRTVCASQAMCEADETCTPVGSMTMACLPN